MMQEVQSEPCIDVPAQRIVDARVRVVVTINGRADTAVGNQRRVAVEQVVHTSPKVQRIVEQRVSRRQIEPVVCLDMAAESIMSAGQRGVGAVAFVGTTRNVAPLEGKAKAERHLERRTCLVPVVRDERKAGTSEQPDAVIGAR